MKAKYVFPATIAGYHFVEELRPAQEHRRFLLARYQHTDGRQAVAKCVRSSSFSLNRLRFQNEVRWYQAVAQLTTEQRQALHQRWPHIHIPEFLSIDEQADAAVLLISFAPGQSLSTAPVDQQVRILEDVIAYLRQLGAVLQPKLGLTRWTAWYQLLSLPIILVRALWLSPNQWRLSFTLVRLFLRSAPAMLRDTTTQFVHRDLFANNILVDDGGNVTILDFDVIAWMHPYTEIVSTTLGLWPNEPVRQAWLTSSLITSILETNAFVYTGFAAYRLLFELGISTQHATTVQSYTDALSNLSVERQPKVDIVFSSYDDIQNPYYAGGGAIAVHQVARRLAKATSVMVLTGRYHGSQNTTIDGVEYRRIGTAFFGPRIGQLVFSFVLPWYVRRLHFRVWIESFTPPFSTGFLQLYTRRPVIGLVHLLSGEEMYRKYRIPFAWIERLGLRFYKHFIVMSEVTVNKIRRWNATAHISIIPNGIDLPTLPPTATEPDAIVFIGRLDIEQKGLDLALDALARVQSQVPYKYVIAGKGSVQDEKKLRDRIQELGLEQRVECIGYVRGAAKEQLFQRAVLVILPSRYETYSIVALEALAHQVPIVSFAIPGVDWLPEHCAKKVPPFDVDAFGNAIVELANNVSQRQAQSQAGLAFVQHQTWDAVAQQYQRAVAYV